MARVGIYASTAPSDHEKARLLLHKRKDSVGAHDCRLHGVDRAGSEGERSQYLVGMAVQAVRCREPH